MTSTYIHLQILFFQAASSQYYYCARWQVGIRYVCGVIILQGALYLYSGRRDTQRASARMAAQICVYLRISAYICVNLYIIIYPKTWSHINIYINYYTTSTSSWVFRMYNRRHAPVWCLGRSVTIVTTISDQVPYYVPYPESIHFRAPCYIWSPHRIPLVGRAS